MTAYRTTDPRRAEALRAYLRRLALALTPAWEPTGERDDFLSALQEIAARLAEETTVRLDRTAERDELAFFDFLGLPPDPPQAATGVLVLTLADNHPAAVTAAARTQLTTDSGALFETTEALHVAPGRIADVFAVDPAADRIERAPADVISSAAPAGPAPAYQAVTFAPATGRLLQLSPAVGLAPGDLLRIESGAYRVAAADKNGLVTLVDPLEAAVPAGTPVAHIRSLESFDLRDEQRHVLYVGHKDLLKLDQPTTIRLEFTPPELADQLSGLDIAYAIWATAPGAADPDWQPLALLGHADGVLRLASTTGRTGQLAIAGQQSRWLRLSLGTSMAGVAEVGEPATRIQIGVATATDASDGSAAAAEGSRTVTRAAHNNTPLSTAQRFLPFGPEPLRFDEFALAAPEALTKAGATVTLDVTIAVASLAGFDITAAGDATTVNGYGVSSTGYLESLSLAPGDFAWREQRPADRLGRPLMLAAPPSAVGVPGPTFDVVAIRETTGDLWSAQLRRDGTGPAADWNALPAKPGSVSTGRPVLVPAPAGTAGVTAVVLDVADGGLVSLELDETGRAITGWMPLLAADGPDPFTRADQIVPVQGTGWPQRPAGRRFELLAAGADGAFWLGPVAVVIAWAPLATTWNRLDPAGGPAPAIPVRAAATRFPTAAGQDSLWIAYVAADNKVHGVLYDGTTTTHFTGGRPVAANTIPQVNPAMIGADGFPATVTIVDGDAEAQVWLSADQILEIPLAAAPSTGRAFLLGSDLTKPAELLVPSAGERVFRTAVQAPVLDYTLHDGVEVDSADPPHAVELTDGDPADPATVWSLVRLPRSNCRLKQGTLRIFQLDGVTLTADQTALRFLRLVTATAPAFTGQLTDRTHLVLDTGDHDTAVGSRLLLTDAAFGVVAIDAATRTAELDRAVPGTVVPQAYQPATLLGPPRRVAATELGTLVELVSAARLDSAARLAFPSPAAPAQRTPALQRLNAGLWVRLDGEWDHQPSRTGRVVVVRTPDPFVWDAVAFDRGYQNPDLSWEYFDGQGWRPLQSGFQDLTRNLSRSGTITFAVPPDLATTDIGGATDYWIRARLIGGDYGRPRYQVTESGTTRTVTVDTSQLHPPEIIAIEASFMLKDLIAPELVLVENNLEVRDETAAAAAGTARFALFQGAAALDPAATERAVHLGLSPGAGRGSLVLFADAADQVGDGPVRVDVRTADGWRALGVDDQTRALRRRGLITTTLEQDPPVVRLFGQDRVWVRLRPEAAASPAEWAPVVSRLLLNAVRITHARTVVNEILGSSLGEPNLTLALAETPVLPDTVELRVQEELGDEERAGLPEGAVVTDPERLPGSWVLWKRVDSLIGQGGDARVYMLDPGSGRIRFGDGRRGKIPPAGRDNIRCFGYQQGGGAEGNQPAWSQAKLTSTVEGVETVALPIDTAGGFTAPPPSSLIGTAPHRIRHAGRGLSAADLEAFAVASSADIVRARCATPAGPRSPIRVTIAVRGLARRPIPTLAQRDAVAAALRAVGWGGLGPDSIEVDGPVFVRATATVRLFAARARLAAVEKAARDAITTLLHPVAGGPDGTGWPFGRRPVRADLLRALDPVAGIDRIDQAEVALEGELPPGGLAWADLTDIAVVVEPLEVTP